MGVGTSFGREWVHFGVEWMLVVVYRGVVGELVLFGEVVTCYFGRKVCREGQVGRTGQP
jgi:hypothetical protein